jgi:hypothetical protein
VIRPDTQSYIDRVVEPELRALRAERDRLSRCLAIKTAFQVRRERMTHEGLVVLSNYARWAMEAQRTGRQLGAAAAYTVLHQNGTRL